jgi:hypothetical protein
MLQPESLPAIPVTLIIRLTHDLGGPEDAACRELIAERLPDLIAHLPPRSRHVLCMGIPDGRAPVIYEGLLLRLRCAWAARTASGDDETFRVVFQRAVADGVLGARVWYLFQRLERYAEHYELGGVFVLDAPLERVRLELAALHGGLFARVPGLGEGTVRRLRALLDVPQPEHEPAWRSRASHRQSKPRARLPT